MRSLRAVYALWLRDLVRFFRQPSRIVSAVATPLIFWVVIGSGLSSSFQIPGADASIPFLRFFFPGTVMLLVLFASIFGAISIIEDRQAGFLQGVQIAPISSLSMVVGKISGATTLACFQGMLLLPIAPLAGIPLTIQSVAASLGVLVLMSLSLSAIGFFFAWKVDSSQGFHAVMNLLLMPMWLLSGSFFPLEGAPLWLVWAARINPMTYAISAFRHCLDPLGSAGDPFASATIPILITSAFALFALGAATWVARRSSPGKAP